MKRKQRKHDYKAEFLMQLKVARLPEPESEVMFHPTRKWRFDFAYPEKKIAIEYQGGIYFGGIGHQGIVGADRDCRKFSEAAALGWKLFLINAGMVRDGTAFGLVSDALRLANVETALDDILGIPKQEDKPCQQT